LSAGLRFAGIGRACGGGWHGWQALLVSRLVLGSRCWFASTVVAGEGRALVCFPGRLGCALVCCQLMLRRMHEPGNGVSA
jgi:hypothetical protein